MPRSLVFLILVAACVLGILLITTFAKRGPLDVFDGCPLTGASHSPDKMADNRLKNRYELPTRQDIDAFVNLDTMLASVGPGALDPRRAAQFIGYVKSVSDGGVESCNCHAINSRDRDTHIQMVAHLGDGPKEVVVVEVTPRTRALAAQRGLDWSTEGLERTLVGKRITVTGWLYFDPDHVDQAFTTDPDDTRGRPNWRGTNWEIHPVTDISAE